ncbi:MAG: DUF2723 domain-containing protein [Chloroflexi bacterium]|nr:DUF2723 domain-containing protein [Chloroflexota bacterium]
MNLNVNNPTQPQRQLDRIIAIGLAILVLFLYLRTMAPTVLDGDNGEFQYMAYILGVPHSTGYPLFMLLVRLFILLPLGDVAFRVNLFSVLCTTVSIPIIYAVALRLTRARIPSILATLVLALIPSVWVGALETKPYAFHFLLGVLALFFAVRWHQDGHSRDFYALALTYGLGLTNHHILAFTAPAFALVVWLNRARVKRSMIGRGVLLVLVPLLLYAYIPIRANYFIAQQDPKNWELYQREDAILKGQVTQYYINTPQGFINLITGLDNIFKLGFLHEKEQADRSFNALYLLVQQFGYAGIALALLGFVESFRRDRKLWAILFLYALGISFIAYVLRAKSTVIYFSLAYFILALWIGFCIDRVMRWTARLHRLMPYVVALLALALPISLLISNYSQLDQSANYAPRDYAQAVFNDDLTPNAVVLAPWEVSEPMHYFQFVENQRPDLLVVNVSPSTRQFNTMLQSARKLNRPFYLAQFSPELPKPNTPRSIQAVPLPLLQAPKPQNRLTDVRIIPEVQVLGFDLQSVQPGKPARISVYYQAPERIYPMYSVTLYVNDITGETWAEYSGFPGSVYFPTYRWYEVGEYYRDAWTINLPSDAPSGLYNLELSWYEYNQKTDSSDVAHEKKVSLGTIRVGDLTATNIAHPATARIGDSMNFLGWSGDTSAARGEILPIDLFWRAEGTLSESLTVFTHLVDSTGRVVADADSPPSSGLYPTDKWQSGESVRDRHILKIPADLAPGNYAIEIGVYRPSNGIRLPIQNGAEQADKIVLTQVSVH